MKNRYKTIGIIGGVGPLATIDLERKILSSVSAKSDQDYPVIISFNNSQIPDRTKALMGEGPDPLPSLVQTARKLVIAGAQVLALPCNTGHAFWDELQGRVSVPIVNMIEEVADTILRDFPGINNVGLLATSGTLKAGLYTKAFGERGLETLQLDDEKQKSLVMEAIYGAQGIKAGHRDQPQKLLKQAAAELVMLGAQVIVMACTEIPLVLDFADVPLVDGNNVLARAVLEIAKQI